MHLVESIIRSIQFSYFGIGILRFQIDFQPDKIAPKPFERAFIMISVDKSVFNLLNDAPCNSTVKVFFFIALNQPEDGVHGLRITKEQLAVSLNAGKSSIFRDLKWLKDNLLIQEIKFVEDFDYMTNPRFVMNNSDFQERMNEWNRRCRIDIQHELDLKRKRRLKAARIQKN